MGAVAYIALAATLDSSQPATYEEGTDRIAGMP